MGRSAETPPDLNTQNGRLRWAREARGYPSARLAARMLRLGNENTYKSTEAGLRKKNKLPLDEATKYARAFKIDLAWLLTGTGAPFPDERKPTPPPAHVETRKRA